MLPGARRQSAPAGLLARLGKGALVRVVGVDRATVELLIGVRLNGQRRADEILLDQSCRKILGSRKGDELWPKVGDGVDREGGISWGS